MTGTRGFDVERVVLLASAGCAAFAIACGSPTVGSPTHPPAAAPVPSPYARLLLPGDTTFTASAQSSSDPTPHTGHVTCTIGEVSRIRDALVASFGCSVDADLGTVDVAASDCNGNLVATPRAVYRVEGASRDPRTAIEDGRLPAARDRLLPASPGAEHRTHPAETDDDVPIDVIVEAHADGWCVTRIGHGYGDGNESRGCQLCIRDGRVIGGAAFFVGHHAEEITWGESLRRSWAIGARR